MISDESYPGWRTVYRGNVSKMWTDIYTLEETMPLWLLEYVLTNKAPAPPNIKISFVLLPWPNPEPGGEQLPELLNTYVSCLIFLSKHNHHCLHSAQSKLTASRFLRVRRLTYHVRPSTLIHLSALRCFIGARQAGEDLNAPKLENVDFLADRIYF